MGGRRRGQGEGAGGEGEVGGGEGEGEVGGTPVLHHSGHRPGFSNVYENKKYLFLIIIILDHVFCLDLTLKVENFKAH